MKKIELLSPAGSMESLKAAIYAGCDAVYLGGKVFGARNFASNFSNEELIEAIRFAHIYGVKVYVTVNTLIFEHEVSKFLEYIDFLHKNSVDAIIIQDLGMMDLVRQTYPNLEIHASTQMHIHNIEGVKLIKELGIKRAVLARETKLEDIKKIKEETNMDLEIFVHGALCISYSGQCLMSYFLGGRSGNRGTCAQCCRMPYDLNSEDKKINNNKYLLSTKDLNLIQNIGSLIDIGVDSFKIEGRMKRPEYVYIVTKLYRKAIDNYLKYKDPKISAKDIEELLKIFNRKFTKGFIFGEENNKIIHQYRPNHMGINIGKIVGIKNSFIKIKLNCDIHQEDGIRILNKNRDVGFILNKIYLNNKLVNKAHKNEVISIYSKEKVNIGDEVIKTSDKISLDNINKEINKKERKIKVNINLECLENKPLKIQMGDGCNKVEFISEFICQKAKTRKITKEEIIKQIDRMKDTAYEIDKINIDLDDNIFIDHYHLNELRREIINLLNEKRCYKINYIKKEYKREVTEYENKKQVSVYLKNEKLFDKLKALKIDRIYSDKKYPNTIFKLPRVMNTFPQLNEKVLIGELGSLRKYGDVITDFSFNVTNSYTVAFLNSLGSKLITLSYENTDDNIKAIIDNYINRYHKKPNLELIVDSYPEIMISKFNLLKQFNINEGYLVNNKNNKFKIEEKDNLMYIYNHEKIIKKDYKKYYDIGVQSLRIDLNDEEDLNQIRKVVNLNKN